MALNIQMPQLGLTMKEGLIAEWKKKLGDPVAKGDVIFSVENDKATVDVEAQGSGLLAAVYVDEMVTVPVGTVVGVIAEAGEKIEAEAAKAPAGKTEAAAVKAPAAAPSAAAPAKAAAPEAKPAAVSASATPAKPAQVNHKPPQADGFVLASPLARQTADVLGINLAEVRGTGPQGAVIGRDLPRAELGSMPIYEKARAPEKAAPQDLQPAAEGDRVIKLSKIQMISAERLAESWRTIPQFTLYDEADAEAILELAAEFKQKGEPVSLTVILAKLLAHAVAAHPLVNGSWLGDGRVMSYSKVNVNIAMDTPEGLVVPVLKDCGGRGFKALGADMKALAEKAKSKSLSPSDYEGGTITLSNLGMFGIKRFRAIVNPPQTAILAVGAISDRLVPGEEELETYRAIEYSITADHRAVDGAHAARFMATLKSLIEDPFLLLI
ncbi:MAG: dihydrolipoamide acetyltransferase family protein [Spirochaetia bacterium]|jgi:pyruvate dehydrogenase E2 component (dihydrolipoamide acetyltransferase)|nr:dihydrolipoamide acetyltransferase family protein [Spirochaetia bacterium]